MRVIDTYWAEIRVFVATLRFYTNTHTHFSYTSKWTPPLVVLILVCIPIIIFFLQYATPYYISSSRSIESTDERHSNLWPTNFLSNFKQTHHEIFQLARERRSCGGKLIGRINYRNEKLTEKKYRRERLRAKCLCRLSLLTNQFKII